MVLEIYVNKQLYIDIQKYISIEIRKIHANPLPGATIEGNGAIGFPKFFLNFYSKF